MGSRESTYENTNKCHSNVYKSYQGKILDACDPKIMTVTRSDGVIIRYNKYEITLNKKKVLFSYYLYQDIKFKTDQTIGHTYYSIKIDPSLQLYLISIHDDFKDLVQIRSNNYSHIIFKCLDPVFHITDRVMLCSIFFDQNTIPKMVFKKVSIKEDLCSIYLLLSSIDIIIDDVKSVITKVLLLL